jgi:hypothetical protein
MIAVTALAVLALAACNQNKAADNGSASTSTTASASAPSGGGGPFPDLFGASYREEATITRDGKTLPVVMQRDHHKMRMEFDTDRGHTISIIDPDANEYIAIVTTNGQTMGMRMHDASTMNDISGAWRDAAAKSHRAGDCAVAGEHGQVWESVDDGGANPRSACVTSDGILLRTTDNGATTWEATSITRGPQPADAFHAPAGVRLMDLGPGAQAAAAAAMARMRSGQGH